MQANNDGILILNKQIEDMTFYIDELKSELEAEREKNSEYVNEIESCRNKLSIYEKEATSWSNELSVENERLNKELIHALLLLKEKERALAETPRLADIPTNVIPNTTSSQLIAKYVRLLKEELIEKENCDVLEMLKLVDVDTYEREHLKEVFDEFVGQFKLNLTRRDKSLGEAAEKVKYTETQLEKLIKEFKLENESLEVRLNEKIHEHNSLKSQVVYILFVVQYHWENIAYWNALGLINILWGSSNKEISEDPVLWHPLLNIFF